MGTILITILLRTVTLPSGAVPFSSVTICYVYSRTCWKPELKDLVTYRNVTSQEVECFERWPGWDEVNGDGRTLQRLCFYSGTPMTSQAMHALFPDTPEFGNCIVSLRTFWAVHLTIIMVNYRVCVCVCVCKTYSTNGVILYIYFFDDR